MMTLETAKFTLDVRNTTWRLTKKTKKCRTWKELAIMLITEFSTDTPLEDALIRKQQSVGKKFLT